METSTWATVASVGMPPSISRAGAGACTTTSSQARQAYFGRRVTMHAELGRHDVEPLGDVLADPMQRAPAARAGLVLDVDDLLDPRQVRRQRTAVGAALRCPVGALGRISRLLAGEALGLDLLGLLEPEQQLVDRQALGPAAEAMALQLLDDLAQPLVLGALGREHRLEARSDRPVGVGRVAHEADSIMDYSGSAS